MEIEVQKWFLKSGLFSKRKTYRVLSSDSESNQNLEAFKFAKGEDTVHLLFSIDMLNEGLHIPEVDAVILLRPTESPIIFYQQIGRCIEVGKDNMPIIFDLVNNFKKVRASDFVSDLNEARENETLRRDDQGLPELNPLVHIEDYTLSTEEVFQTIRDRLISWKVMFEELLGFRTTHGHCNVPREYPDNPELGSWINNLRSNKNKLHGEKINRLEEIGFVWRIKAS